MPHPEVARPASIFDDWLPLNALVAHGRIETHRIFQSAPSRAEPEKAATQFVVSAVAHSKDTPMINEGP